MIKSRLWNPKTWAWGNLAATTLIAVYFYVFMEWLFTVTRPSFMDLLSLEDKLGILLLLGLLLFIGCLAVLLPLFLLSLVPGIARTGRVLLAAGTGVPAAFLAAAALMLLDNFTYTIFRFGIVKTVGFERTLYAAGFVLAFAALWVRVGRDVLRQPKQLVVRDSVKTRMIASGAILLLSIPLGGALYKTDPPLRATAQGTATRRPNILLIGSDGLNADQLSLYGAARETTPYLTQLAQTSLLAENNFPNANITAGSVVSILTSKLPTQTRMLYPPDIVTGINSFQHLPAILKAQGYYNAEISVDYYGDSSALNLQNSFVEVNGRSVTVGRLYTLSRQRVPENAAYFLSTIAKRLSDRVLHIFSIRSMPDPYAEVTQKLNTVSDPERIDQIMTLFRDVHQPLFIHVHMMGTHEGNLAPQNDTFSKGEQPTGANVTDYYDDAILDFDHYMQQITSQLAAMGKLDNTVIIVYTDHGFGNVSNVRIPLIFHFPGGEHAGKISNNTQNLDISPTLLDYLGLPVPSWMGGVSLLKGEPPALRPVFSAEPSYREHNDTGRLQLDTTRVKPPFYQFGQVGMVLCQEWYALKTTPPITWEQGAVKGYVSDGAGACAASSQPTNTQARQMLLDRLTQDGFDVSSVSAAEQ